MTNPDEQAQKALLEVLQELGPADVRTALQLFLAAREKNKDLDLDRLQAALVGLLRESKASADQSLRFRRHNVAKVA